MKARQKPGLRNAVSIVVREPLIAQQTEQEKRKKERKKRKEKKKQQSTSCRPPQEHCGKLSRDWIARMRKKRKVGN